ncbi:hypothetical protein ACJX0J_010132, partial [Zea mays]
CFFVLHAPFCFTIGTSSATFFSVISIFAYFQITCHPTVTLTFVLIMELGNLLISWKQYLFCFFVLLVPFCFTIGTSSATFFSVISIFIFKGLEVTCICYLLQLDSFIFASYIVAIFSTTLFFVILNNEIVIINTMGYFYFVNASHIGLDSAKTPNYFLPFYTATRQIICYNDSVINLACITCGWYAGALYGLDVYVRTFTFMIYDQYYLLYYVMQIYHHLLVMLRCILCLYSWQISKT